MLRNYRPGCAPSWAYQMDGFRMPDSFFHQFTGKRFSTSDDIPWLCAKFCRDEAYEHRIVLGSEDGKVGFAFANKYEPPKLVNNLNSFVNDAVTAVSFVPKHSSKIVTCNGSYGQIRLIEADTGTIQTFDYSSFYPERTIKTISFHDDVPFVFATGGRSGTVSIWDIRNKKAAREPDNMYNEYNIFPKMEIDYPHRPSYQHFDLNHMSIISLVHISPHLIVSVGNNQDSGVRFWDLRYQKSSQPLITKDLPDGCIPLSLSLDRHGDKLFVNTTGKMILEYDTGVGMDPVYAYHYPKQTRCIAGSCCSPVSDHLLVGVTGSNSLIYDLQKNTYYGDVLSSNIDPILSDDTIPKFELSGSAGGDFSVVDWSCRGRYMLSLDELNMYIYDNHWPTNVEYEPVKLESENQSTVIYETEGRSLHRLIYSDDYRKKSKDPKWNYTAARRIGLHEIDMNAPPKVLPKKISRKRKADNNTYDILSFLIKKTNSEVTNEMPTIKEEVLSQVENIAE